VVVLSGTAKACARRRRLVLGTESGGNQGAHEFWRNPMSLSVGLPKAMRALSVVAFITWSVGCSLFAVGCSSSKELNERSGRALVKEATADAYYPIPLTGLAPLMQQRSLVDFGQLAALMEKKGVENGTAILVFGRLLDQKLIVQHVDAVSYPNIHGGFRSDSKYGYAEYELEMVPNTNHIKGVRYEQGQDEAQQHQSDVTGTIDASGLVSLGPNRYQYKEEGSTAWLMDKDVSFVRNYKGTVSGPMIEVKWYTYSFSPEVQAQIVKTKDAPFGFGLYEVETVKGGSYEIGDVSGLELMTDTDAVGSFAWRASLNKFGRAFYGTEKPSGNGRVKFGKKPDGTWFVKNWCTMNCMF